MKRKLLSVCAVVPLAFNLVSAFRASSFLSLPLFPQRFATAARHPRTSGPIFGFRMSSSAAADPYAQLHPPPAKKGDDLSQVDTPALCVSLDALEANCDALAALMTPYAGKVAVRPHAKASKSGELASMVIQRINQANPDVECKGVCCQKLTEAEAVFRHGGVADILLTNQIVGAPKIDRLVRLALDAHQAAPGAASIAVLVDDISNLKEIAAAAVAAGTCIKVLVEIDAGQKRCGLAAPLSPDTVEPLVALVRLAVELEGVQFEGIHCYQGTLQHLRTPEERSSKVQEQVVVAAKAAVSALEAAGLWQPSYTVTGGGTGTFPYECASGAFTEVQPGSFVFMDVDYNSNQWPNAAAAPAPFRSSLHVLALVMSRTPPSSGGGGRAVLDAGSKAIDYGSAPPLIVPSPYAMSDNGGLRCRNGGDEHSVVDLASPDDGTREDGTDRFAVGSKVWLVPGHCDPTVNMHDYFVCHRGGKVESVIPILGRGAGS